MNFVVPADHRVETKGSDQKNEYLDFARELKKQPMEHESDGDTNCNWYVRNCPQGLGKGT